jgi:TetR/AcrR family transcriptional regulator, ethionamide resistance regulator
VQVRPPVRGGLSRSLAWPYAVGVPATTPKRAAIQAEVLRATEELLAGGASWADLGVERITSGAGISRTAFYFYFRDKRELLMRLTEDVTEQLYDEADRWYHGDGEPEDVIREALGKIWAVYREHAPLLKAIVEVATYDDEVATFWRSLLDRFVVATRERIEAEQAAGRARPMPPEATGFALTWMTERTLYQQLVQERFDADEVIEALVGLWLRGVYG